MIKNRQYFVSNISQYYQLYKINITFALLLYGIKTTLVILLNYVIPNRLVYETKSRMLLDG